MSAFSLKGKERRTRTIGRSKDVPSVNSGKEVIVNITTGRSLVGRAKPKPSKGDLVEAVDAYKKAVAGVLTVPNKVRSGGVSDYDHILSDVRVRAERLGATPGVALQRDQARHILAQIVSDSRDIFPSPQSAANFLENRNFAGSGSTAFTLIKKGQAATVLSRLDEIRYGSQG